ncbi:MAG: ribosome silencing factor [Candidatus Marinimicrobia bacterium]|nr:ribosome silencing factor [Candidatus Neomarinimicrobiota bacterium]
MTKNKKYSDEEIKELAIKAARLAENKKALDIKLLDLRKITSMTDYFIICTGEVEEHVKAIVKSVEKGLIKTDNFKAYHIEGYNNANWVVMDYFDFVVHIFKPESREYYNLEKLWGDAPEVQFA